MLGCFGSDNQKQEDPTVVYRIETLDENEAAFLPHDIPEVILDTTNVTPDGLVLMENDRVIPHANNVPTVSLKSSANIRGMHYAPKVQSLVPLAPVRSRAISSSSTINRTKSVDTVHLMHKKAIIRRPIVPNYIPINTHRRNRDYAGSTMGYVQAPPAYLVVPPEQAVYAKPSSDIYYGSNKRPHSSRLQEYRSPSKAESYSYTLSRPPGRAEPIRIPNRQNQPVSKNINDVSATHLLRKEQYRYENDVVAAHYASDGRDWNHESAGFNRHSSGSQYRIEAFLEPSSSPYSTLPDRPHGTKPKASNYQVEQNNTHGATDISQVPNKDGGKNEWQDISLFVRRPSLEDVQRVNGATKDHAPTYVDPIRYNMKNSYTNSQHNQATKGYAQSNPTHHTQSRISKETTSRHHVERANKPKYVIRTNIPHQVPAAISTMPRIMLNDQAMHF